MHLMVLILFNCKVWARKVLDECIHWEVQKPQQAAAFSWHLLKAAQKDDGLAAVHHFSLDVVK